ncbi:MAG: helix-turn-helix domain-containing protein [Oscillospiraceae bacterium]|nr:helix-turn-helix domain-containing protein [Oscillospiraceae bacterium]
MKLSIQILFSSLKGLNLKPHIRNAPRAELTLSSAGFSPAPNRICISEKGPDVVCRHGDDYFVIRGCGRERALDLLQSVFDAFNEWEGRAIDLILGSEWVELLKSFHPFVSKPLVLFDENLSVAAMTPQYSLGSVNDEWDYLMTFGVSSAATYQAGRANPTLVDSLERENGLFMQRSAADPSTTFLTASVLSNSTLYYYLSSLSIGEPFSDSEVQLIRFLSQLITKHLPLSREVPDLPPSELVNQGSGHIFEECLKGYCSKEVLSRQLSYLGWEVNDLYTVYGIIYTGSNTDEQLQTARHAFISSSTIPCVLLNQMLVFILNDSKPENPSSLEKLRFLSRRFHGFILSSLQVHSIFDTRYGFLQLQFMRNYIDYQQMEFDFYPYALDYILLSADLTNLLRACHPGIVNLFFHEKESKRVFLEALAAYLSTERSITEAARFLKIHKNTLSYRVNRALEISGIDVNSHYDREYAKLSLRLFLLSTSSPRFTQMPVPEDPR